MLILSFPQSCFTSEEQQQNSEASTATQPEELQKTLVKTKQDFEKFITETNQTISNLKEEASDLQLKLKQKQQTINDAVSEIAKVNEKLYTLNTTATKNIEEKKALQNQIATLTKEKQALDQKTTEYSKLYLKQQTELNSTANTLNKNVINDIVHAIEQGVQHGNPAIAYWTLIKLLNNQDALEYLELVKNTLSSHIKSEKLYPLDLDSYFDTAFNTGIFALIISGIMLTHKFNIAPTIDAFLAKAPWMNSTRAYTLRMAVSCGLLYNAFKAFKNYFIEYNKNKTRATLKKEFSSSAITNSSDFSQLNTALQALARKKRTWSN